MDELTRERYPEFFRAHLFEPDGEQWLDRVVRCKRCEMPRRNRIHQVPDRAKEQQEHQRRTGVRE